MSARLSIGIIGGSGMLGRAIAQALVERSGAKPADLWVSSRKGASPGFAGCKVTTDNQALVDACDVIVLSVPPAQFSQVNIKANGRLVVSVMAGITLDQICQTTGASRAVRAMSSPAAAQGLAYSPWAATGAVTDQDRDKVRALFEPCGQTDELPDESDIDYFTAMTGPVPGFVAYFAACMVDYATSRGISPQIANKSVRQLFLAAGTVMAASDADAQDHVAQMIDYQGTTAAGLNAMIKAGLADQIANGLDAAVAKSRSMGVN